MISVNSAVMQAWVIGLLWPLTRVLGVIALAPILGHKAVPNRVKLGLGIMITLVIMPTLPAMPVFDIMSIKGLFLLIQQLIIGLAIGFSMRIVFAAIEFAGYMIGMAMGLGFATFFDPQTRGQSTAISQFLLILGMLVFLSLDGHLLFVTTVAQSFVSMPVVVDGPGVDAMKIAQWGETVFSAGLLLAMPVVAALLVTNMALGVLTRSAPQLNLFGIGFPITISIGFVVLALSLPTMLKPIEHLIELGASRMLEIGAK